MNNRELDELLEVVKPPRRDALYWETFPTRVQSHLARQRPAKAIVNGHRRRLQLWNLGFASIGVAVALFFALKFAHSTRERNQELETLRNCYRETADLFGGQLKALRVESGAFHLDLSDKADVPESAPLFVRACKNSQCGAAVTFSGQQIELLGQKFEVLVDGRGGIMLLTQHGVVSSADGRLARLGRLEVGWLNERL